MNPFFIEHPPISFYKSLQYVQFKSTFVRATERCTRKVDWMRCSETRQCNLTLKSSKTCASCQVGTWSTGCRTILARSVYNVRTADRARIMRHPVGSGFWAMVTTENHLFNIIFSYSTWMYFIFSFSISCHIIINF